MSGSAALCSIYRQIVGTIRRVADPGEDEPDPTLEKLSGSGPRKINLNCFLSHSIQNLLRSELVQNTRIRSPGRLYASILAFPIHIFNIFQILSNTIPPLSKPERWKRCQKKFFFRFVMMFWVI